MAPWASAQGKVGPMQAAKRSIGIGIIGLGTVGGGVAQLLLTHRADYVSAYGIDIDVRRGCALDIGMARAAGLPDDRFTSDWHDVVADPTVDIVVELIGGEHPATEIYEAAFAAGKHVVTANKALLGRHVERLAKLAHDAGVQIKCEAAAAGGIPVVNALEHTLVGNKILTIAGILNGTTNYILSRMASEGADYANVLADAQRLGYAEADPSADVDGFDAASKTAIMASIGFHTRVTTDEVYQQGIRQVSAEDIAVAADMGYTIKLLGIARMTAAGVEARVHPTMIPNGHQLAAVSGAMNAVYVVGDAVGETMFYGAGAGRFPTASAVVGDIFSLAEPMSRGEDPLPEIEPLPGARAEEQSTTAGQKTHSFTERHGEMSSKIASENEYDNSLVCECEDVTVGEINYAMKELDVNNLVDLRRRTRIGMGTCQGGLCACRAAGLLGKAENCMQKAQLDLTSFLNERWKGLYPVAWGSALRESEFSQWVYGGVCGME